METTNLIPLNEAPNHLPAPLGKKVSLPTIWRWATKGVSGIRLESVRYGRRWYTTQAALDNFSRQLAARSIETLEAKHSTSPATVQTPARSDKRRAAEISEAKSRLRAAGIAVDV